MRSRGLEMSAAGMTHVITTGGPMANLEASKRTVKIGESMCCPMTSEVVQALGTADGRVSASAYWKQVIFQADRGWTDLAIHGNRQRQLQREHCSQRRQMKRTLHGDQDLTHGVLITMLL